MTDGGKGWERRGGQPGSTASGSGSGSTSGTRAGVSEPRRLVDEPPGDPSSPRGWAVELLRTAGPHRAPAGRKQRVRLGLGQPGARRAPLVLRPAIAAVILFGCGAAASAALGHWPSLVARAYRQLVSPAPAVAPPPVEPRARARRAQSHATARVLPPELSQPTVELDLPAVAPPAPPPASATAPASPPARTLAMTPPARASAPGHAANTAVSRARRSAPGVRHATAIGEAQAASAEDTSPVLEAMRVLRVDGNPVRARWLLGRYLQQHPGGSLAEEALAMSIEAAVAHHDGDATALARKYLARYPAGHFSVLARQTLDGSAGAAR